MYLKIDRELLMELWECANTLALRADTPEKKADALLVACKAATYLTAQPAADCGLEQDKGLVEALERAEQVMWHSESNHDTDAQAIQEALAAFRAAQEGE